MQDKKKVLIDHQIFTLQTYGGISRVFTELYKKLKVRKDIECNIPILLSENEYLKEVFKTKTIFKGNNSFIKKIFLYILNRVYNTFKLIKNDFDVFQPTYYDPYFLPFLNNKPFVLVIHDMTHEIYPETVSKKDKTIVWKKKLVNKANKIVAISENTKKDIVKFYGIDESKIDVIYWATDLNVSKTNLNIDLPNKYILFVGNRNTYKNFDLFFKSIRKLLNEDKDLHLVCAGSRSFSDDEIKMFKENNVDNKVHHIRFKDDSELAYIYSKAVCFVFPSLYEGFGIPVLEAFACGCPAVISNVSSLPEVGGDAVEYFDPSDEKSIMESVKKVVYDNNLRKEMVEKGKKRLKLFDWDVTAKKFVKIYKDLIED